MKSIFQSKTVYLGLAVAIIPFLQALQALPLNETTASVLSSILGLLVIVNRFYTTGSIGVVSKPE